jgi:hypothetical protein
MPARLNRRRFKEAVSALKEIISNPKTPAQRRLRAVETLLSIYDRHDRTEAAKDARRRSAGTPSEPATPDSQEQPSPAPESAQDAARKFLASLENSTNG